MGAALWYLNFDQLVGNFFDISKKEAYSKQCGQKDGWVLWGINSYINELINI